MPAIGRVLLCCALLGLQGVDCARPAIARADKPAVSIKEPPDSEPAGYRLAIDAALSEFEAGNFEEARSLFNRAHGLFPSARTLRGIGMVEFELRNYESCILYLERSLTATERALDASLRAATEGLLARARGFVATVHLDVQPGDTRATILVDGVPVHVASNGSLVLQVGDHLLEVHDDSYLPERRKLSLHGGERQELVISLRKPRDPDDLGRGRQPVYKRAWLWTSVGVLVAGAAAATAIALSRSGSASATADGGNTGVSLTGPRP